MASSTAINGNIQTQQSTQVPNLDSRYGPYNSTTDVLNNLAQPGDVLASNGLTVGVWENGTIVDYMFINIMQGQTPTAANLVKKVSDATITVTQTGQVDQTFTLNQPGNKTINITGEPQVQANWTETNTSSKSYIQNKPTNFVYYTEIN